MEHKGTVTLETPRLILRRLTLADAEPMYRNWASDPGVTKFLTWPTHSSVEVTKQILALWASHYEELNYYQRSATASAKTGGTRAIRAKHSVP